MGESSGSSGENDFPIRWNLIIIATMIAGLSGGIIFLTYAAIKQEGENQFITGALIGLLPTGITGLVGLGTTMLTERRRNSRNRDQEAS